MKKKKNEIPASLTEILNETGAKTAGTYPEFDQIMRNMINKNDIPISVQLKKKKWLPD